MGLNFNLPGFAFNLPWFMFDIDNKQFITSVTVPSEIADRKDVVLAETPIPGLNFQPVTYGGGGNRKISFTIPIIKRNNSIGNVLILKQFENLRNQAVGLTGVFGNQFTPNPKVLYYYGTGSIPLVYHVKKCDFVHQGPGWINQLGNPKYTLVEIELWLDETNTLFLAEEVYRKIASLVGMVENAYTVVEEQKIGQRPY